MQQNDEGHPPDRPCLPPAQAAIDERWMRLALEQAAIAAAGGEVPVGAVLCGDGVMIAAAGNSPIGLSDPTAHAEILALRAAAGAIGNYRLTGTTLYVTLEPCIMCMGAIIHARVERLVFGALDPKTGAAVSRYRIGSDGLLNHQIEITSGVLIEECATLLREFFHQRRGNGRSP
ncbi:MAG: tRNA adenosine(34) deaminase TadA [Desulfobulbaceae bacterium]|nr:MAG: tRNA adenosine(34) deaminase TadA [Desulfobulbaceae bacterium]